jgi:MFS family permease
MSDASAGPQGRTAHPARPEGAHSSATMPAPRQRVTLLVGSMAGFMIGLDATVVTTALPTIHASQHASASTLGWTVSAYSLAFAALVLTGTALADKFGRRRVFLAGLAVFTLASAACAVSPSAGWLIAARAVQGAGGGIATPLSLVLITEAYPVARRGAVVGAWGAITGVAVAFGPVIGGAIVQGLAWQWVFWVNVPIGVVLVALGRSLLAESRGPDRRLDPAGLVLATGAIFAVTDALLRGPHAGWGSAQVLALFAAGAVLGAGFTVAERRSRQPMLPLGPVRQYHPHRRRRHPVRPVRCHLRLRLPDPAVPAAGARLQPAAHRARRRAVHRPDDADRPGGGPAGRPARRAPRHPRRVRRRRGRFTLLGLTTTAADSYRGLLGPLLLAGAGVALAFPPAVAASLRAIPGHQLGLASGIGSTFQNIGGVFGIATATAVFASTGSYLSPAAFVDGLRPALLALAALAFLGGLAALAVKTPGAAPQAAIAARRSQAGREDAPARRDTP